MERFDVAIIGAGPAGSSAAISLARLGYNAVVIDRARFPRDKLCGDFLNPVNWPVLCELGVAEEILCHGHGKISRFRMTSPTGVEAAGALPCGNRRSGLGIRRYHLDDALLRQAISQGVAFKQGCTVKQIARGDREWLLTLGGEAGVEAFAATVLIGADGRNSKTARMLGVARAHAHGEVGFETHLRSVTSVSDAVEIHLFPGGYAGLVRVDAHTVNLCFSVQSRVLPRPISFGSLRERLLSCNAFLRERLAGSEAVGELRSTSPIYFRPRRCYGDGFVLAGDAARVTEPASGEGVYFALRSGQLAAATVDSGFRWGDHSVRRLRAYRQACASEFRARARANAVLRFLIYRPSLIDPLIRLSAKRGQVLDALLQLFCAPAYGTAS